MRRRVRLAATSALVIALLAGQQASAEKRGGILKLASPASPASMSPMEEATIVAEMPMMGVFNNLVLFDQHVPQVSLETIRPDLATEWSWNEDGTELVFKLRQGVKWHDGKPFTSADVKCTYDLQMDTASEKLRVNPRKSSFDNLDRVTVNGDFEVIFRLKRPQPTFPMLLASGFSTIYPCHVSPQTMRTHPIGTGPFKFVEFKPNEVIRVARNPDYWKPDLPYFDGVEYSIVRDPSTAALAFVSGQFDMTFPFELTLPRMQDISSQVPQAICQLMPVPVNRHLLVNREKPPFNNPDLRRAMALAIDRQAFVDTLAQGKGEI